VTTIETADEHRASQDAGAPRWHQRALPVLGGVLAVVALAAALSPGVRHQLVLSSTHQRQSFVELYFAEAPDGTRALCAQDGARATVSFTVASHLDEPRELAYVVSVDRRGGAADRSAGRTQEGTVHVRPGEVAHVDRVVRGAGAAYDVAVRLPGSDQEIRAHCGGADR